MTMIKVGDTVRWARDKRDNPHAPVRNHEIFVVQKVYANGRCDLIDSSAAQLFNIPTSHLQKLQNESNPVPPAARGTQASVG